MISAQRGFGSTLRGAGPVSLTTLKLRPISTFRLHAFMMALRIRDARARWLREQPCVLCVTRGVICTATELNRITEREILTCCVSIKGLLKIFDLLISPKILSCYIFLSSKDFLLVQRKLRQGICFIICVLGRIPS